jgi:hypothetical protein
MPDEMCCKSRLGAQWDRLMINEQGACVRVCVCVSPCLPLCLPPPPTVVSLIVSCPSLLSHWCHSQSDPLFKFRNNAQLAAQ